MKLKEIAERIHAHLARMEGDPEINFSRPHGMGRFWNAGCSVGGRFVYVSYVRFQGLTALTKAEAERYLAYLDGGGTARHWQAFQSAEAKP